MAGGASGGESGLVFDPKMIKSIADIDASNTNDLAKQTLGLALTILHEYGHYGDQKLNDGNNTGQFEYESRKTGGSSFLARKYHSVIFGGNNIDKGKQKTWPITLTGHRGTDIEVVGFGVQVSVDVNTGRTKIVKGSLSKTTMPGRAEVPLSLPNNAKGEEILKTLDVK